MQHLSIFREKIIAFMRSNMVTLYLMKQGISMNAENKLSDLKTLLQKMESVLIAFSGGVDSTFLLKVAHDVLGDKAIAATAVSSIHPDFEHEEALQYATEIGVEHIVVETNAMMEDKTFLSNPPNRCYICKKMIFSGLLTLAEKKDIRVVADGSNMDDEGDFRPGLKALKELGIRSPLKETGLTKNEIRHLSKERNLPTWNKPALACLATRIPYGTNITQEKLLRIAEAEKVLRKLGFRQIRVRDHDTMARIEVLPQERSFFSDDELTALIVLKLKTLGYKYVALDLEGYRSGSLNEVLNNNE